MSKYKFWPEDWPKHYNNGVECDMLVGLCACRAWHEAGEFAIEGEVLTRYGKPVIPWSKEEIERREYACHQGPGDSPDFNSELTGLLNRHSEENASNTPDWILRNYILGCLEAFNQGIRERDSWYGIKPRPGV